MTGLPRAAAFAPGKGHCALSATGGLILAGGANFHSNVSGRRAAEVNAAAGEQGAVEAHVAAGELRVAEAGCAAGELGIVEVAAVEDRSGEIEVPPPATTLRRPPAGAR